jgi:hypothetical protein
MFEIVIALIPLLLLVAALLLGRYPGHAAAMRLGERIAARRRPELAGLAGAFRPRLLDLHAARGGLLLACGLSGRAPPARP